MDDSKNIALLSDDKVAPHAAASELILGMLIARLDKIHPGLQEDLRSDMELLTKRFRAEAVTPIRDLDEVQVAASQVLRPYSG